MIQNEKFYSKFKDLSPTELSDEFIRACYLGYLDIIKYLLISPDLKENVNIHTDEDKGLINACMKGNLEIVKYLLTSPDLKENSDIHAKNDLGFIWACERGRLKIIQFLVIDMNMKKTEYIENYLKEHPKHKQIENMFKIRDLNSNLEKNCHLIK